MDVTTCIRRTRATRDFADEPVSDDDVRTLIDSARRAGSGHNRQPWTFVVVRDSARLETLASFGNYTTPLRRAPLGIVLVVNEHDEPLKHEHNVFDAGRAAQNLTLAATALELGIVPQAIHEKSDAAELLEIPDGKRALIAFAVGHPAADPDERIEGVEKADELDSMGRKAVDEVLHWETHGE